MQHMRTRRECKRATSYHNRLDSPSSFHHHSRLPPQGPQTAVHITQLAGGGMRAHTRPPHAPVHFSEVPRDSAGGSSVPQSPTSQQMTQTTTAMDRGNQRLQQQQQQWIGVYAPGGAASRRQFESLMDEFSLHEVMIRKGVIVRDTPEFESYHRTFSSVWHVVEGLLQHLAALCSQYVVPLAVVNGKSIADLAQQVKPG